MYSLGIPRKKSIDALQKHIDLYFKEINKLRSTQNSRVPISGLPAELLSEVFLYLVESGLKDDRLGFTWGTFRFRLVCTRWNEVAIGFPHLWVWWAPGAFNAWGLFNARSKNAPISLTWLPCWRIEPPFGNGIFEDPTIPGRIRTLDCSGTNDQLEYILGGFGSSHSSDASSVRLHITPYDEQGPRKSTTTFLSLSFPKLSKLDINNSLPDVSSPIFTTSNLVSLKLGIPYTDERRYTQSQFSKILQRHQNLQELHLWEGGMPQVEPSEPPAPVVLPQLVDLRLCGTEAMISGFMDLLSMSSPLHSVIIDFRSATTMTVSALTNVVKKILPSYYEQQGLDYPRTADHLTISDSRKKSLVFDAGSRSTSVSHPASNLKLQFSGVDKSLVGEIWLLFPLDRVLEFTAIGLRLARVKYREILEKMEGLLHLRLNKMDPGPVMGALGFGDQIEGVHKVAAETMLDYLHTDS